MERWNNEKAKLIGAGDLRHGVGSILRDIRERGLVFINSLFHFFTIPIFQSSIIPFSS